MNAARRRVKDDFPIICEVDFLARFSPLTAAPVSWFAALSSSTPMTHHRNTKAATRRVTAFVAIWWRRWGAVVSIRAWT
jgi:hypothetical protein